MASKRGFNLIEIAIVLAVIGLVIGGIYVAASAVTEGNRKQTMQKQIIQIVSNVRAIYSGQPAINGAVGNPLLNDNQIKQLNIFPGDISYDGTKFNGVYGQVALVTNNRPGEFELKMFGVTRQGCMGIYAMLFNSSRLKNDFGVAGLNVNGVGITPFDSVSVAEASGYCDNAANNVNMAFFQLS